MIPVLLGPKKRYFVIDHHHLARALQEEGVESVLVTVVADLHKLDKDAFWTVADHKSWVHAYNADGVRVGFDDVPKRIAELTDDPFRSLAGELRRAGGFAKDTTPFSEFLWTDFLRRNLKRKAIERDFTASLESALSLAKSPDAGYLPGWCGPLDG
ncbi:Chromosome partitioning protein ParB [Methylorubrum populi]